MRKLLSITWVASSILLACQAPHADAANIYVDNTLGANCAAGDYSTTNRLCNGSDGNAYMTIQSAINACAVGDIIYMRGGTYRENNGNTEIEIEIPHSKSGDSWETGHYTTLTSHPGEWAIIDGEGTAPKGVVLGLKGMTYCPTCVLRYWKFERFEITGGGSIGNGNQGGAGLWLPEGPFIIRYLYIHDNWDDAQLNNPAGLLMYRPQNSVIEYSYFHHNGCNDGGNCRQIAIFNDYCDEVTQSQCQNPPFADTVNDINRATRGNSIRYNFFDGGPGGATNGLGYKTSQLLDPNDGSLWTNKALGDRIHHNIFTNHLGANAILHQDYIQFYNNILIGNLKISEYHNSHRLKTTVYNNTISSGSLEAYSYASNAESNEPFIPWNYVYNNIIDNSPSANNESRAINYWPYADGDCAYIDTSNLDIDRNYIYRPQNGIHVYMSGKTSCGGRYGQMTVSEFNNDYSESNYYKASSEDTDNLMRGSSGADAYLTREAHVIAGSTTLANGGIGGSHPYLPFMLPTYMGAVDPQDNAWVAGILSLSDVDTMKNATGAPSWATNTTTPARIRGLNIQ